MARPSLRTLYAQIRGLTAGVGDDAPSDGELLQRYLSRRDESAFAALVHRHGAMVLATCRRLAPCEQDAEDAWQATFLILACRGKSIRKRDHLAGWLHGVACRVARRLRVNQLRHRTEQLPDLPATETAPDIGWREAQALLDEELERLPEQYRAPIVLCYLEGLTRDEAARRLGWTLATLRGRLERARERLRYRLTRRGVTLSATLAGGFLAGPAGATEVPAVLMVSAVRSALQVTKGLAPGAIVSVRIVTLMEGVIQTMCWTKAKLAAVLILGACLAGLSAGLLAQSEKLTAPTGVTRPPPVALPGEGKPLPEAAKPLNLAQRVAELEKQVARLSLQVESLTRQSAKATPRTAEPSTLAAIQLNSIRSEDAARILRDLLGENREGFSLGVDPRGGTLAFKGSVADLEKVKQILSRIDVPKKLVAPENTPAPADPVLKTYTFRAARAEDVARAVQQILKDKDVRVASISAKSIIVHASPADARLVEALVARIEEQAEIEAKAALKEKLKVLPEGMD